MRRADIISATIITAFGLAVIFVIIPIWVPGHEKGDYGLRAQDFPYIGAIAFTALAAYFAVRQAFFTKPATDDAAPIGRQGWSFLGITLAILIVTYALLYYFGILAGGPVMVALFMIMMGERRPLPIAVLALGAPVLLWLFFWKLLKFPLPEGVF
ncbi:MAG: tripartite tricarboxylate transporter TctB family protein [Alphaproteobacteria bacterium]